MNFYRDKITTPIKSSEQCKMARINHGKIHIYRETDEYEILFRIT